MYENAYVKLDDVLDEMGLSVRLLRERGEDAAADAVETEVINMQRLERTIIGDEVHGHWDDGVCSVCGGHPIDEVFDLSGFYNCCPFCGALMREEDEE